MTNFSHDIGIIGGDMRQVYMADLLTQEGYSVIAYSLPEKGSSSYSTASSLYETIHSSRILTAPIPLTKNQIDITCKQKAEDMTLEILNSHLTNQHLLFAGCISNELIEYYHQKGIFAYDYMQNKELAVYNSIATAEGAIAIAISKGTVNLHGSRCLVTGYGACAKTLAGCLSGLHADITICARNAEARAEAETNGYHATHFGHVEKDIDSYDFIFNTIPALILPAKLLKKVRQNTIIIDIASAPGGLDYVYAREAGIKASLCPGLPGIYAPESSAKALVALLKSKIQECERLCH